MNETTANGLTLGPDSAIIADTPEAIALVRATIIASGAALYLNTGIKPNRAYTPTRMRDALNDITGAKAKRLVGALAAYVDARAAAGVPVTNPQVLKAVQGYAVSTKGQQA
jgi:hypothetical protein